MKIKNIINLVILVSIAFTGSAFAGQDEINIQRGVDIEALAPTSD